MTIHLVMGGSGYFGSLLAEKLLIDGNKVRIFDINKPEIMPSDVEFIQGDIRNRELVDKACKGVSVAYNVIAQVPLAKQKSLFFSVNVLGARILYEEAIRHRIKKLIYVSSSAVFGIPEKNPVNSETLPRPMEDYGKAKYAAELLGKYYYKQGLDVSIIRPRTILGHGRLGIFSILFDWVKRGINIPVLGEGRNIYQFIHAEDLASACIKSGRKKGYQTYNIGAARYSSMRESLEKLIEHAGSKSRIVSVPMPLAEKLMEITNFLGISPLGPYHSMMYGRDMFFDIERSINELNWQPKYSNAEMICESFDWFCSNLDVIAAGGNGKSVHQKITNKKILRLWELLSYLNTT